MGMPGATPAFQAVYHDYIILFGNAGLNAEGTFKSLPMLVGESLVNGDQLGWFNIWAMFFENHPRREELGIFWEDEARRKRWVDFVVRIARLRHNAGYKFLVLGEMLKPLTIETPLPIIEGSWGDPARGLRRMPAVVHSVWKAPDSALGLVFCNISSQEHEVKYKLDVTHYGLPEGRKYTVAMHGIDGSKNALERYDSALFERTERVPPLSSLILEVRAE